MKQRTPGLGTSSQMPRWGDFWLNEGFTVWAERRILEALKGKEAVALDATIGRLDLDREIERFGKDSPFTCLENQLEGIDPDEIYSTVPYEKGFLFVTLLERSLGRKDFDAFVQSYIQHFQFQSISTQEFESFVETKRPGLLARVGAEDWLRKPGVPENAPSFSSKTLDELEQIIEAFGQGERPNKQLVEAWSFAERQLFLQRLPRPLPEQALAWLDDKLQLSHSGNSELRCEWIVIALSSGHSSAVELARDFVMKIGRMKFLKPIYSALKEVDLGTARGIFNDAADRYHPIARAGLESLLGIESN